MKIKEYRRATNRRVSDQQVWDRQATRFRFSRIPSTVDNYVDPRQLYVDRNFLNPWKFVKIQLLEIRDPLGGLNT